MSVFSSSTSSSASSSTSSPTFSSYRERRASDFSLSSSYSPPSLEGFSLCDGEGATPTATSPTPIITCDGARSNSYARLRFNHRDEFEDVGYESGYEEEATRMQRRRRSTPSSIKRRTRPTCYRATASRLDAGCSYELDEHSLPKLEHEIISQRPMGIHVQSDARVGLGLGLPSGLNSWPAEPAVRCSTDHPPTQRPMGEFHHDKTRDVPKLEDRRYHRAPPPATWLGSWLAQRSGSSPPLLKGTSLSSSLWGPKRSFKCSPRTYAVSNAFLWMAADANNSRL